MALGVLKHPLMKQQFILMQATLYLNMRLYLFSLFSLLR